MPAIEVSHLTKEYRLGALQSLKDTALNAGRRLLGRPVAERPLFKALDDVSFTVEPGEVVGIIGHNGAGKSTLLKMLARISTPTSGTVKVNGRIAPLIEVGAGFVPDFTGRENVYLNAAILGMSKAEIDRKFDEIVDFAEMAEFIDTPVKRYSSGMQVKLAFAVATSVDSEILIVDEVLAVGDLAFQRKSFGRMIDLIRDGGRTVLIVSHNIRQIERICTRALLLDHGRVARDGNVSEVCDEFFSGSNAKIALDAASHSRARVRASGEADLVSIGLVDERGDYVSGIASGAPLRVKVTFSLKAPLKAPELIVGTHTTDFFYLTASSTASIADRPDLDVGTHQVQCTFRGFPLTPGAYCLRFAIYDQDRRAVYLGDNLATFEVRGTVAEAREEGLRMLEIPADWSLPYEERRAASGAASGRILTGPLSESCR